MTNSIFSIFLFPQSPLSGSAAGTKLTLTWSGELKIEKRCVPCAAQGHGDGQVAAWQFLRGLFIEPHNER